MENKKLEINPEAKRMLDLSRELGYIKVRREMEDLNLDNSIKKYPYLRFWSYVGDLIVDKIKPDMAKSVFHYRNIILFIWIIFFNPVMVLMYITYLVTFTLLYFTRH